MPLLFNYHMMLGKEQIPQMMQTLVNQYTPRGSSNTDSREQPNDVFKSGKQPVPKSDCHLAVKVLE